MACTVCSRVDVGTLFDTSDKELRAAFNWEMNQQNKRSARFRLRSEPYPIDNDDSYNVSAASKLYSHHCHHVY